MLDTVSGKPRMHLYSGKGTAAVNELNCNGQCAAKLRQNIPAVIGEVAFIGISSILKRI